MKKTILILMTAALVLFMISIQAEASGDLTSSYEEIIIDNIPYYIETTITESALAVPYSARDLQHKTATKTTYYRDADHNVLWSVSITATFYYDGESAVCTSYSHQADAPGSTWSIKSVSSSSSGNSATATATATQTLLFGVTKDYTQSVTIYCSPDGTIS